MSYEKLALIKNHFILSEHKKLYKFSQEHTPYFGQKTSYKYHIVAPQYIKTVDIPWFGPHKSPKVKGLDQYDGTRNFGFKNWPSNRDSTLWSMSAATECYSAA